MSSPIKNDDFTMGTLTVKAGRKASGELPVVKLITGNQISIPFYVFNGVSPGPAIWVSAAIHGDEIAGVEIIRRIISRINPQKLSGTLVAVPIVNVHGFLNQERYLPDRRDLNRSFPGSAKGSLAARIAHLFMSEVVRRCDIGIDLHTGSNNRNNLPQLRSNLDDSETKSLCDTFGVPFMLHSKIRDGSLREAACNLGKKVLIYEGGEANRYDEESINYAVDGIMRVLVAQKMIEDPISPSNVKTLVSRSSSWLRAKKSGIGLLNANLGDPVKKGEQLGVIYDSLGTRLGRIIAHKNGIIIGKYTQPLINQGDALYHIGEI